MKLSFRGKIFASFVLCCFCVVLLRQNLESIYLALLKPGEMAWEMNSPSEWVFFVAILLAIAVGAFAFYQLTSRIIKSESERRVKEQNLIYAAIAHDLRTPMTSVQGYAQALSDGRIKPEDQQETFDIIYRKSQAMNDLVEALFDYAKLGTEGYQPNKEEIDLCALVRDVIAESYTDLEEHGIGLEIDIPNEAITIRGDKNELRRALMNLVANVYKHNPAGIKAGVFVRREGGKPVVRIADSGSPIPESMDVFEPFVTENAARSSGHGTGLGLAITRRIIRRHNGDVFLRQDEDGYTKSFIVRI